MQEGNREVKQNRSRGPRWIDISIPLRDSMVRWPTDPPTVIKRFRDVDRGDPVTMS
jgi:arylformamidase